MSHCFYSCTHKSQTPESKKCSEILETAEKKIKILIQDEDKLKEEDFDVE